MSFAKIEKGLLLSVYAVLVFACVCFSPHKTLSQTKDFAVEVAALRSQECAAELAGGLLARGFEAYLVKGSQAEYGTYYRVRVGKFQALDEARAYAESLLDSGLLDTCSITIYEEPLNSILRSGSSKAEGLQASLINTPLAASCPVKLPAESAGPVEDLISSVSRNKWLLSPNKSVVYTLPQQKIVSPVRDVVVLMRAIDRNRWRLSNDIAQILAPPVRKKPASKPAPDIVVATPTIPAANRSSLNTAIRSINPNLSANISDGLRGLEPAPVAIVEASMSSAPVAREPEVTRVAEINRPVAPTTARPLTNLTPPKLQGSMEMRDGRLLLKLKNTDSRRSFSGVARVTLSDDKQLNDVAPMELELQPGEEQLIPVNETTMPYGDWMLMVYDDRQTIQLIRSAPFGQRPAPVENTVAQTNPVIQDAQIEGGQWKLADTSEDNPPANGLPNVTGVYDATSPAGSNQSSKGGGNNSSGRSNNGSARNAAPTAGPGRINITPRQIAVTGDNVTTELELSSSQAIGYVRVLLRSGNFQDERYALMSTPSGRVPFLIPISEAKGQFGYEVKDEAGRVLASGVGDFKQLAPGN